MNHEFFYLAFTERFPPGAIIIAMKALVIILVLLAAACVQAQQPAPKPAPNDCPPPPVGTPGPACREGGISLYFSNNSTEEDRKPVLNPQDLPPAVLRECANLPAKMTDEQILALRAKLLSPQYLLPEAERMTVQILQGPALYSSSSEAWLVLIPKRGMCLLERKEKRITLRAKASVTDLGDDPEKMNFQADWSMDIESRDHLLLLHEGGGSLGTWSARLFRIPPDGKRIEFVDSQGNEDAFSELHIARDAANRTYTWSEWESLAEGRRGWLCSQGWNEEHEEEFEQKVVAAELQLGHRLTDDEAEQYKEGDCSPREDNSPVVPSDCSLLSSKGFQPVACPAFPSAGHEVSGDSPDIKPETKPLPPRRLPFAIIEGNGDKGRGVRDDEYKPDPADLPETILRDCFMAPRSGKREPADRSATERTPAQWHQLIRKRDPGESAPPVYFRVPYAFPGAGKPALIAAGDALCLLGEQNETPTLLSAVRIRAAVTPFAWLLWLPGSTPRYRYLIHATPPVPASKPLNWQQDQSERGRLFAPPATAAGHSILRLFRLDVGIKKLVLLHQLQVAGNWNAYEIDEQPVIANHDPYDRKWVHEYCVPGVLGRDNSRETLARCDPLQRVNDRVIIVNHGRLEIVRPENPLK